MIFNELIFKSIFLINRKLDTIKKELPVGQTKSVLTFNFYLIAPLVLIHAL